MALWPWISHAILQGILANLLLVLWPWIFHAAFTRVLKAQGAEKGYSVQVVGRRGNSVHKMLKEEKFSGQDVEKGGYSVYKTLKGGYSLYETLKEEEKTQWTRC